MRDDCKFSIHACIDLCMSVSGIHKARLIKERKPSLLMKKFTNNIATCIVNG